MPGLQNLNGLSGGNQNYTLGQPSVLNQLQPNQNWSFAQPQQQKNNGFFDNLKSFFFGSPESYEQLPLYNQDQSGGFMQALQMALGGLQNPQQGFAPIANQARSQFNQVTVPGIAERFSALGSGAQGSSAFANTLGQSAADLETNLAALGSQYGMQNQSNLQNLLRLGLAPQFETNFNKRQPGHFENNLNTGLQNIGKILPFLL